MKIDAQRISHCAARTYKNTSLHCCRLVCHRMVEPGGIEPPSASTRLQDLRA